jgi:site-specific DNA-methyltransferase (adenine-specific)
MLAALGCKNRHRRNIEAMAKYEENGHTIYHGDALDVLRSEIPSESVDLVFVASVQYRKEIFQFS